MKWTLVRTFGSIKYFNVSYVVLAAVPILHELYVRSDTWFTWLGGAWEVSPELKWAYIASLLFGFGIALYHLFCPPEIKRYRGATDYADAEFEQWLRSHPHRRLETVTAQLDPNIDKNALDKINALRERARSGAGRESSDAQEELDKELEFLAPAATQRFLETDFNEKNRCKPIARWASGILYFFGSSIILLLLVVKSYAVLIGPSGGMMQIKSYFETAKNALVMDAYTYDLREFKSLEIVLNRAQGPANFNPLKNDDYDRQGRRYSVQQDFVSKAEAVLMGRFDERGQFSLSPSATGQTYACRQLARGGKGPGCEELVATDQHLATTQCALIAGKRKWWGGVAQPGKCPKSGGLFGWFR